MAKNRLDFEAHLSRHSHDITAGYTASLTTGCIVPQYFHVLNPGDTIYYNSKMFVRFKDVVTAFLGEVDVHLDYFFVPLQMLYLPFGQIFAQTNDVVSSSFKNLGVRDTFPLLANFPYFDGEGYPQYGLNYNPISFESGHIECVGKEQVRLLDALNVNPLGYLVFTGKPSVEGQLDDSRGFNPLLSPWAFAAYQAIYQNFYRNDEFEKFDIQSYNIDQYFNESTFVNDRMTKLRYVQRPSDYFTSIRVSPIASGINRLGNNDDAGSATLGDLLNKTRQFIGNNNFGSSDVNGDQGRSSFNSVTIQDADYDRGFASNIRALFAVDKFLRVYGRAGKTYDDQILAHFGVKVPHDVKHQATKLASYHTAIGSDPVYSTSTTGVDTGSVLGQVGGQASGEIKVVGDEKSRGKYAAKFTAPVHGVFMAVAYAVTKPRYSCTFNKLHLLKDRLSFPIPEFDKLGAQPLYAFEAYPHTLGLEASNYGVNRIGWQNRYQEFKKKYNRVSLNYLHSDMDEFLGAENNSFSAWVLSRQPYGSFGLDDVSSTLISSDDLFERPDALNSVMAVPYDGTWHNEYYAHPHEILDTDPLITEFQCEAKLVSWMSETGEPDMGM